MITLPLGITAKLLLGSNAAAPFAILGIGSDLVNAAIVAGIFSVVNTALQVVLLQRVSVVAAQVGAVKKAAHEGNEALVALHDDQQSKQGDK